MSGRCKNCRWREEFDTGSGVIQNRCILTQTEDGKRPEHTKAYAVDADDYFAVLVVEPDFGCIQFRPKESYFIDAEGSMVFDSHLCE